MRRVCSRTWMARACSTPHAWRPASVWRTTRTVRFSVWIEFPRKDSARRAAQSLRGTRAFIDEADRWKRRIGSAMRRSGIIAARMPAALDNNVVRLADDHVKRTADGIARIEWLYVIDARSVETEPRLFRRDRMRTTRRGKYARRFQSAASA